MSSMIRSIQKRILKAQGFHKRYLTEEDGTRKGYVFNGSDELVGEHYPKHIKRINKES